MKMKLDWTDGKRVLEEEFDGKRWRYCVSKSLMSGESLEVESYFRGRWWWIASMTFAFFTWRATIADFVSDEEKKRLLGIKSFLGRATLDESISRLEVILKVGVPGPVKSENGLLEDAIAFACARHAGQVDKAGVPYILHPLGVMAGVTSIREKVVAVLHDVLEDTDARMDDLRKLGLDDELCRAVDAVTRRKGESYEAFILRCKLDPIGSAVKVADLKHNLSRIYGLPVELQGMEERYRRALAVLEDA